MTDEAAWDRADPEAVVQRQLDAYNARDIDAFVACYGGDATLQPLNAERPTPRQRLAAARARLFGSRDRIRRIYGQIFDESPQLHAQVLSRVIQGDYVIDREYVTGQPRGPFIAVAIYEVRDGLIVRVWFIE